MRIKSFIILALIVLTAYGCQGDEIKVHDVEYSRPLNFAAPIAIVDAPCEAIFNRLAEDHDKMHFLIDENDMFYAEYPTEYRFGWDDILRLKAIKSNVEEEFYLSKGASLKKKITAKCQINTIATQRLDSIFVSSMMMKFNIAPMLAQGKGTIKIPEIVDSKGKPFTANWSLQSGYTLDEGLTDYVIYPKSDGNDTSYININYTLDGEMSKATSLFKSEFSITKLKPSIAYGYFGNFQLCNRDEKKLIELFDNDDVPLSIEFKGSWIDMNIENRAGCEFNVILDDMNFVSNDGTSRELIFMDNNSLFVQQNSVKSFIKNKNIAPKDNKFHLDSSNSNIDEVINIHPNHFNYNLKIYTNPHGENQVNYIDDTKELYSDVKLYIPLWVRVKHLERNDTIDFDLEDVFADDNIDYIDKASITLKVDNNMPTKLYAQGYYINEKGAVVDSLFEKKHVICESPKLNSADRIEKKSHHDEVIEMTNEQLTNYYHKGVNRLILKTIVTTEDYGDKFVKCYKEYGLNVKITTNIVSKNSRK